MDASLRASGVVKTVIYRDIFGFPGYRVGDDGSVWSAWRKGTAGKGSGRGAGAFYISGVWKRLSTSRTNRGYRSVQLTSSGVAQTRLLHRIVLESFVGPCPAGMEACHKDGDRANNTRLNLRWDTPQANWSDREKHGRGCKGAKNPSVKLTPDQVCSIWRLCKSGHARRRVANQFNVSNSLIDHIMTGRLWSHLTTTLEAPA